MRPPGSCLRGYSEAIVGPRSQLPISPNCVSDASLVPETCLESGNRTLLCNQAKIHLYGFRVYQDLAL
jgi:hypothetical protein